MCTLYKKSVIILQCRCYTREYIKHVNFNMWPSKTASLPFKFCPEFLSHFPFSFLYFRPMGIFAFYNQFKNILPLHAGSLCLLPVVPKLLKPGIKLRTMHIKFVTNPTLAKWSCEVFSIHTCNSPWHIKRMVTVKYCFLQPECYQRSFVQRSQ